MFSLYVNEIVRLVPGRKCSRSHLRNRRFKHPMPKLPYRMIGAAENVIEQTIRPATERQEGITVVIGQETWNLVAIVAVPNDT